MFVCSWVYATNCVMNRALKGINSGVIMFWHGLFGLILALIVAVIAHYASESSGSGFSLFKYTSDVYWLMLAGALVDTMTVNSMTIAF